MTANSQTCLAASTGIHVAAFALLLFAPTLVPRNTHDLVSPELTILSSDIKLTDGNTIGGGSPDVRLPPPANPAQNPTSTQQVTPPAERKPIQQPRPEVPPAPQTPPPKSPPKVSTQKVQPEAAALPKKAQDVDPTLREVKPRKSITVAQKAVKLSKADAEAEEAATKAAQKAAAQAEAKAAKERADRIAAAKEQYSRALAERADAIRGAAGSLKSTLQGSMKIGVPGNGGQAYAPYTSYLQAFYKLRWKKPATLNVDHGEVGAEIVIRRDGRVTSFRIVSPSGIRALDDSVREVLDRHRQLEPLPEGSDDPERVITIRFDLSAAASL
jgi:TonB family protein